MYIYVYICIYIYMYIYVYIYMYIYVYIYICKVLDVKSKVLDGPTACLCTYQFLVGLKAYFLPATTTLVSHTHRGLRV